ncbi:hypothetical protein SAMN04487934_10684 [Eubacterium ruminantium]|nr:hypothetical protein SAMN04487934_10684 [Eubacterium ruminantium]
MEYEIIRSRRKTIAILIKPDCSVVVRAPYRISKSVVEDFVKEKSSWIEKHLDKMKALQEEKPECIRLSEEEIRRLSDESLKVIPPRVKEIAEKMGVSYGRITIRNQKTRWGSCSSKGNLNFNCQLMLLPEELRDYVIIHELCHRIEMNHSVRFWTEVERYCPQYMKLRKKLKQIRIR